MPEREERKAQAPADKGRHENEPAFILHAYPYRETSLVVETFTRNFGRVPMVAKGARRPRSALRGALLQFQPLLLSWFGKTELRTLSRAEWQGGLSRLAGMGLICGFYLNELLLRLLARDDPHETLFDHYRETIGELGRSRDFGPALRRFEMVLLRELGYALILDHEAQSRAPVCEDRLYTYAVEHGPVPAGGAGNGGASPAVSGKTLLDMAAGNYLDPQTQQQARGLMRYLISHYLGDQPLHTRQLLKDLHQL
ncbi:MAG: DNA repair protein RecO [Betaproteobacteria bacterium]|nr:DNA repair protein RecO [Betaproteobacteria bacterium]